MQRLPATLFLAAAFITAAACSGPRAPGSWTEMETGVSNAFYSVNFVNERVGWINGQTDRSSIPVESNANGNANANASRAAARNDNANRPVDPLKANQGFEVLQTTDGGQTWKQIPDQFKYKIRSVWFVDEQTGWALTIDRDILKTTDGGQTWALQRQAGRVQMKLTGNRREPVVEVPEQIEHVHFLDANRGWAWGGGRKDEYAEQPGIFLTTVDGGRNWTAVTYPFEQPVQSIFFLDGDNAWASTMDGRFHRTTDGGLNWAQVQAKLPEDVFNSIFFVDTNLGWVVGRSGRLARTEDGGRTWRKMYEIKDEFKMRDVFFLDRERGWVVGRGGAVLYTPDGGASWANASVYNPVEFQDVLFLPSGTGYAVGLGGAAFRYDP